MPLCVHLRGAGYVHRCVPRPRLYTKEAHWGVLVPLPSEFAAVIRTLGLDTLLAGLEFDGVHRGSLVKCAIGRAALNIDWDNATAEAEHAHEVFFLYDYDTGRVYGCDEQIRYVSVRDHRTYRG